MLRATNRQISENTAVNINATLFGQMIFFVIFVMFCMKFVWPPIVQAMADRAKKISDGLAEADRATRDLALAQVRCSFEAAIAIHESLRIGQAEAVNTLLHVADAEQIGRVSSLKFLRGRLRLGSCGRRRGRIKKRCKKRGILCAFAAGLRPFHPRDRRPRNARYGRG